MATKLALYNAALLEIEERRLASLSEGVEARRVLDDVYDAVVNECLSAGSWNFAVETIQSDADTGVEPAFGYTEVFAKPSDWVRTFAVSGDEDFSYPLTEYYDDANYWSAPVSPIFVRYVSNDTGMGFELTRWPRAFTRYVEMELAWRICGRLGHATDKERIMRDRDRSRKVALSQDAMNDVQPKFPPAGRLTQSRWGRSSGGDRGRRDSLTS